MKGDKQLLLWVQSLRGIAALSVMLLHARYILVDPLGKELGQIFLYPAAMGVDLFFLVSGFIMVITTANFDPAGKRSYAVDFAIKRFSRIWPLYAIITIFSLVLGAGFSYVWHHYKILTLESLFFIPAHPENQLYFGLPVSVAWTLCFEFYFYAILTFSLLAGKFRWWAAAGWFAITLIGYSLLTGQTSLNVFKREPIFWLRYANIAVNPIIWDFIFGLIIGGIYKSRLEIKSTLILHLMLFLSCIGILVQAITGTESVHGPIGWGMALFPFMLSLALLSKQKAVYFPKWTVWMGEISYSLYLTHLYSFTLVHKFMAAMMPIMRDPSRVPIVEFVLSPAIAIPIAAIVYYAIERPVSNGTRKLLLALHAKRSPDSFRVSSSAPPVPR